VLVLLLVGSSLLAYRGTAWVVMRWHVGRLERRDHRRAARRLLFEVSATPAAVRRIRASDIVGAIVFLILMPLLIAFLARRTTVGMWVALATWWLVGSWAMARWRMLRISDALLASGRCACCGYALVALRREDDDCRVCPECGAAWRIFMLTADGADSSGARPP
jgi:hypothetical protein